MPIYNAERTADTNRYPLRAVVSTEQRDGRQYERLECGHERFVNTGEPNGWMGEWPAKRRRCRQCKPLKGGRDGLGC